MFINSFNPNVFLDKKYVLLDNDFLTSLFHSNDLADSFVNLIPKGKKVYLYQLTEFEFLRDVFVPKEREIREKFISTDFFGKMKKDKHAEMFNQLYENSILLSKIYAHNNEKSKSSFVDLMLASLLMYSGSQLALITGNKRDFPSCVFDTLSVLNYEDTGGNIRTMSVVCFNKNKFDARYSKLQQLG
jgi:hypothetical protein